jgi:hypothetical protein
MPAQRTAKRLATTIFASSGSVGNNDQW